MVNIGARTKIAISYGTTVIFNWTPIMIIDRNFLRGVQDVAIFGSFLPIKCSDRWLYCGDKTHRIVGAHLKVGHAIQMKFI